MVNINTGRRGHENINLPLVIMIFLKHGIRVWINRYQFSGETQLFFCRDFSQPVKPFTIRRKSQYSTAAV